MNKITVGALSALALVSVGSVVAIEARPLTGLFIADQTLDAAFKKDDVRQFKIFLRQARAGDPHSQRVVASSYEMGFGIKKDMAKAKYWYRKSAEQGNAEAQYELGYILANGIAGPKDTVESQRWLCAAYAQEFRVNSYPCVAAIKKKIEMHKLTKAADKLWSQNRKAEATEMWRQAAEADYGPAQYIYALQLRKSDGQTLDWKRACDWIERSDNNHYIKAAVFLGKCHSSGEWRKQDWIVARRMFEKAALHGDASSLRELGTLYIDGRGVVKNPPHGQMLSWIGLVMQNAKAIKINLNNIGRRIPTAEDALAWLKEGVELGDAASEWLYGNAFHDGYGTGKNLVKAYEWIFKAATHRLGMAMNQLAILYMQGVGVEQNTDMAYAWGMVSARLGNAKARQSIEAAEELSSISQNAHRLADALYEKYFRSRV